MSGPVSAREPASSRNRTTPSERRQQILDAAADLFARHGFHGVGIDDIGAAVGVSGPALYRHFRGKDAMLGEMLTGISEKLLAGGRERVDAARAPEEALAALVRWHVEFALANPDLITVHTRDLGNLADPVRHQVRELQRRYVEVWTSAVRAGAGPAGGGTSPEVVDEPNARAAAHAVLGLINSTPHSAHLDGADMARLLERMALGALAEA